MSEKSRNILKTLKPWLKWLHYGTKTREEIEELGFEMWDLFSRNMNGEMEELEEKHLKYLGLLDDLKITPETLHSWVVSSNTHRPTPAELKSILNFCRKESAFIPIPVSHYPEDPLDDVEEAINDYEYYLAQSEADATLELS